MKRILLTGLLTFMLLSPSTGSQIGVADRTVYICTGGFSKRYHSTPECSGLNNCQGEIKSISISSAQKMGRTPCKLCFK